MDFSNVLFGLAIVSVLWGVVSSIAITSWLSARGEKINFLFIRLFIFKYISQYRKLTTEDLGHPGFWFYSYVYSMMLTLAFAAAGFTLKLI